ncbi:UV DNA damage repair endonuclease UvsE [Lutispora thermophila]|uniref:UV-damage endonuclease n=1 Tax=Lutispora thermophila DSM 19022 TaxID=1122184 RepID=A0A1M6H1R1_9FIRM|nr:UV DNA damage repair endonuclease UvsE [Lutispora thermophila]SHJ16075.1 UV-damage endonuclease [Lutispora thermophila DSM 19022]
MIFRLGYVAMTLNLADCSPSTTVTVANFSKLSDDDTRLYKLRKITQKNLHNTLRILRYNEAYNIKVFRFTSKLVPLATHPLTEGWDYAKDFEKEFKEIGDFVKSRDFRVSAHPGHYTLINSKSKEVVKSSIKDLEYHVRVFEAMGLEDYKYKLVIHIGGLYKDKEESIERFKENFVMLPDGIRKRLILENDDKSYTAYDVLNICKELKVPMVLDVHHHRCVNNGEDLEDLLPEIFDTWNGEAFNPKVHFSSSKNPKNFRSHADDIDVDEFRSFLDIAKKIGRDFDVMLEAKNKDVALLNLSNKLEKIEGIKKINEGEFEI